MNCKVIVLKKHVGEKLYSNYYLVFENNVKVAITPTFKDGYAKLKVVAEVQEVTIEKNEKETKK